MNKIRKTSTSVLFCLSGFNETGILNLKCEKLLCSFNKKNTEENIFKQTQNHDIYNTQLIHYYTMNSIKIQNIK